MHRLAASCVTEVQGYNVNWATYHFNSVERRSTKPKSILRHIRDRETPAALYLAIRLYRKSGSKSVINVLHQQGLCISYDRLRMLSTDIANSVIGQWEQVCEVVPPRAIKDVFPTGDFDNMDHNPSSTTAKSALHGTCISIHQHFSSDTPVEGVVDILNPAEMGKKVVRVCQPATQQLIWTSRYLTIQLYMFLSMEPTVIIFQLHVL